MIKKIIDSIIPHSIGLLLIIIGWYISILNVGLTRFQSDVLFTKWTGFGLLMIVVGAYLPWVWTGIRGKISKD